MPGHALLARVAGNGAIGRPAAPVALTVSTVAGTSLSVYLASNIRAASGSIIAEILVLRSAAGCPHRFVGLCAGIATQSAGAFAYAFAVLTGLVDVALFIHPVQAVVAVIRLAASFNRAGSGAGEVY